MNTESNVRSSNDSSFEQRCASIISISSGKGGVGKTQICANLAVSIAEMGNKVCIVDADHGLANINIVLGISATQTSTKQTDEAAFNQIYNLYEPLPFVLQTNLGVDLLPAKSGLSSNTLTQPSAIQIKNMLDRLSLSYDVILIDTAAGIDEKVKNYIAASDKTLVIINSEPTSLTDSFGLIRTMQDVSESFEIVVNRVSGANAASKIYKRFASAVKKYIGTPVSALGYIRDDTLVSAALLSQRALVKYSPECMASVCILRLAERLIEDIESSPKTDRFESILQNSTHPSSKIKAETETDTETKIEPEVISAKKRVNPLEKSASEETELHSLTSANDHKIIFENWLAQAEQFFDTEKVTRQEKKQRVDKFLAELERLCDKDKELLISLEALVVNLGIEESIDDYEKTKRLTRFNLSGNTFTS